MVPCYLICLQGAADKSAAPIQRNVIAVVREYKNVTVAYTKGTTKVCIYILKNSLQRYVTTKKHAAGLIHSREGGGLAGRITQVFTTKFLSLTMEKQLPN
jgi:hypothetical protein